jgi:hypothetical protein
VEGSGAQLLFPNANVTDMDHDFLSSITVSAANFPDTVAETLAASVAGTSINFFFSNTTAVLAGPDTPANFTRVLQSLTYTHALASPGNPITSPRVFTVTATDSVNVSIAATATLTFASVNDAPILDLDSAAAGNDYVTSFTEEGPAIALSNSLVLTDIDTPLLASAQVTITNYLDGPVETL